MRREFAFTLAELLIALAILGVISTFTIPKVLQSQQDGRYNSIAKEAAAAVSGAYQAYLKDYGPSVNTSFNNLSPYLSYVKMDTAGYLVDYYQTDTSANDCTGTRVCLFLHNGAVLKGTSQSFGNSASTNAIRFYVDPDAKYDPTGVGPGKSVMFYLYYNGRLSTRGGITPNTCDTGTCDNPNPTQDPPWFHWN